MPNIQLFAAMVLLTITACSDVRKIPAPFVSAGKTAVTPVVLDTSLPDCEMIQDGDCHKTHHPNAADVAALMQQSTGKQEQPK